MRLRCLAERMIPLAFSFVVVAACGDEEPSEVAFVAPPSQPLAMTPEMRGITVEPVRSLFNNLDVFQRDLGAARNVVFVSQIHSEYAQRTNAAGGPSFSARLAATRAGAEGRVGTAIDTADREWWVVDLQRLDREWLVDWTGGVRDEPDNRLANFTVGVRYLDHGGDYPAAVDAEIQRALTTAANRPHALILGTELDRYWLENRDDWPFVVQMLRTLMAGAKTAHPEVRIGVGINWSHFMDVVVPSLLTEAGRSRVDYEAVRYAWEQVIEPIYAPEGMERVPDFYAFASIPDPERYGGDPNRISDTHYAFLPTHFAQDPSARKPIAWFALGWPNANHTPQSDATFLRRFLQLNRADGVELVAWAGFADFLAQSECPANLISDVPAPRSYCFRGLYPEVPAFTTDTQSSGVFFGR